MITIFGEATNATYCIASYPDFQIWREYLPSGKRLHSELENHHFQWVNPL